MKGVRVGCGIAKPIIFLVHLCTVVWLTSKRFSKHRSCPNMAYQRGLLVSLPVSQHISWLTASVTSKLRSKRGLLVWLTSKRFSKHRSWPNMAYQCGLLVSQHIQWLIASVTSKLCSNRGILVWLTSKHFSKRTLMSNPG